MHLSLCQITSEYSRLQHFVRFEPWGDSSVRVTTVWTVCYKRCDNVWCVCVCVLCCVRITIPLSSRPRPEKADLLEVLLQPWEYFVKNTRNLWGYINISHEIMCLYDIGMSMISNWSISPHKRGISTCLNEGCLYALLPILAGLNSFCWLHWLLQTSHFFQ